MRSKIIKRITGFHAGAESNSGTHVVEKLLRELSGISTHVYKILYIRFERMGYLRTIKISYEAPFRSWPMIVRHFAIIRQKFAKHIACKRHAL